MRRPTLIILTCLSFVVGIALGYYYLFGFSAWWLVFGAVAIVTAIVVHKSLRAIPILCLALVIGITAVSYSMKLRSENGLSRYEYQKAEVVGEVVGDPYKDKDFNYVFTIANLRVNGQARAGMLRVKTFSAMATEGNIVRAQGKVFPILAKPGYQISYAKVDVLTKTQPPLVSLKQTFYRGIERSLPEPSGGFVKGILIGARSSLPQSAQDTLNAVGLSHVVAVSGYNLTILVVLLARVLGKRWRWGSLVLSIGLIIGFTLLTGASASIVRAAIMASVFLLASYYGRPLSIFVCVSITAVLTLLVSPTAAIEDIGWQLSFLSLIGIIVLAPVFQALLPKRIKLVSEILAVTLAAQVATVPYMLYVFGTYSLLAVVANVVVMPLVPLLMAAGFVAGLVGIIVPEIAFSIASPLDFVVRQIFSFLEFLQSKHGFVFATKPTLSTLVAWYALLCMVGIITYRKSLRVNLVKDLSNTSLGEKIVGVNYKSS